MADESRISLKAFVNKRNNRIMFVESGSDFVETLFSFLSIPIGTIIRLARSHSVPVEIGCMNNLYASVENLDVQHFRTEACKDMLLCPRSRAGATLKNLKFNIEDHETTRYFRCSNVSCQSFPTKISYYSSVCCHCGYLMDREINLSVKVGDEVFVKGLSRLIISDHLQVMAPGTPAISVFFEKLGSMDSNSIEEVTMNIGVDEVLNLLLCSFVSKTPLTDILLKNTGNQPIHTVSYTQMLGDTMGDGANMSVKLIVSKSKKVVCYAEAGEDFVNFLFSFLILPLGFILKQIWFDLKGCVDHLYRSVQDLDEKFLKSHFCNELLLSPKLPPRFCYKNHPLGIAMASYRFESAEIVDPKSHANEKVCDQGFLKGPAMFMVTDSLAVTSISPILGLSILNEMNVPITDIEVKTVYVGKEEVSLIYYFCFPLLNPSSVLNIQLVSLTQI
ncbi:hypothetical protein RchiOBHm_Chr5g0067441 [Rosa chinensis]|uniref:DUF674 family protein n=1 Tax=Rosa chinensis TaxID=74649 RepID=A0A2P6QJF9_ROSCH|nr:uncharacterized protein LOC112167744 isoform X1 [Rosa chinensis]PRQ34315.1 hypothetical protein RchiOBHm_Chr5g0067441 [Rosa chinensis]